MLIVIHRKAAEYRLIIYGPTGTCRSFLLSLPSIHSTKLCLESLTEHQTDRLDAQTSRCQGSACVHISHTALLSGTNGLNEELIGFSEAGCSPGESFKFLGSVKSSQTEDEDRRGGGGKEDGLREDSF